MHNKEQEQAIHFGAGPLLVLAGPGSGKTYVITHRIIHLISEKKIPPNQILVITFTKSAALEMQRRAVCSCQEANHVQFGTFHSIFYHILKISNPNKQYQIIADKERMEFVKSCMRAFGKEEKNIDILQETETCLKKISIIKNTFIGDVNSDLKKANHFEEKYVRVFNEYQAWLTEHHKLDFDDMILLCYQQLSKDLRLRNYWQERFSHILIDEFQDINAIQYETIKLLSKDGNVFAVGDDDQAIYSFRGANPMLMRQFQTDYNATIICLSYNYRSHKDIVFQAGALIKHNRNRFEKQIEAVSQATNSIRMLQLSSKDEELRILSDEWKSFERKNDSKTQVILTRTNGLAYAYRNMLQAGYVDGLLNDIISYLSFINEGQKRQDFFKIMNKPVRYISSGLLSDTTVRFSVLKRRLSDKPWIAERVNELELQVNFARKLDLAGQIRYIFHAMGYGDYYRNSQFVKDNAISETQILKSLDFMMRKAKECRSLQELKVTCINGAETKKSEYMSMVMTYHASKGLEFDRVYLPDLEYGKVPHGRMLLQEELEEERRMFYVAMTRAKESLWLLCDKSQIGSPFLQELSILNEYY